MYTVYKVNMDGTLTKKEHLNNQHEINDWMWRAYDNGFPTVRIQKDEWLSLDGFPWMAFPGWLSLDDC